MSNQARRFIAYWCRQCRAYEHAGSRNLGSYRALACGHRISTRQAAVLVNGRMHYVETIQRVQDTLDDALDD